MNDPVDPVPTPGSVTFVTPGFPPTSGGVEAHVGAIAAQLVDLGWTVRVLTARRGIRRMVTEQVHGAEVTVYPAWRVRSMSLSPRLIWAGLRAGGTDVVHVHSYHASTGFCALRRRPALVFTPHFHGGGHTRLASLLHRGYRLLGRRMFACSDAIICVSHAERDLLESEHPAARGRTHVIPNGVDPGRTGVVDPFPDRPPTVISIGRLEPYKRVDAVIAAFVHVPAPARLEIIGQGSDAERLRALAAELGIADRVGFHGFVPDADLSRWMHTATVLVSVSEHEAFGMVPIEAAACGARVVLSDIAAHRELHDRFLQGRDEIATDLAPEELADVLSAQLRRGRADLSLDVPTWPEITLATARVYRSVLGAEQMKDT